MDRVEVGHHAARAVAHHDCLDSICLEHRFRELCVEVVRKCANDEESFALFHRYFNSTVAGFCGEIIR